MSTQKNGSNGTAAPKPQANGTHTSETTTVLKVVKDEPKKTETPAPIKQPSNLPPVEDRVLKVQQLFDLAGKREKLQESLKKLNSLDVSSDNRLLKITIDDGENDEWETHNTDAIRTCIDAMKQTIQTKLKEVENLIRF